LARFRNTLSYQGRSASPPLTTKAETSSVGSELESTWNEFKKGWRDIRVINPILGGWLERAFTELVFSDSGAPDAAARKVDELWREAMLASALSNVQKVDTERDNLRELKLRDSPEKVNKV
jgi:hypothetical protein